MTRHGGTHIYLISVWEAEAGKEAEDSNSLKPTRNAQQFQRCKGKGQFCRGKTYVSRGGIAVFSRVTVTQQFQTCLYLSAGSAFPKVLCTCPCPMTNSTFTSLRARPIIPKDTGVGKGWLSHHCRSSITKNLFINMSLPQVRYAQQNVILQRTFSLSLHSFVMKL